MTSVDKLADAVIAELSEHRKLRRNLTVGNSVTVDGVALIPDGEFGGVKFADVRKVTHRTGPNTLRMLYEQIVWLGSNPDLDETPRKVIARVTGARQAKDIVGLTPHATLIRLLWWISCHESAKLELGAHTCLVHGLGDPMGIRNGQVISRFAADATLSTDPRVVLAYPGNRITIRDRSFVNLWRLGIRVRADDSLLRALVMLWLVDAPTLHRVHRTVTQRPLTEARKEDLKNVALTAKDPAGKLFSRLVPVVMTRSEFERQFGVVVDRQVPPDARRRQFLYTKLLMLFQKEQ